MSMACLCDVHDFTELHKSCLTPIIGINKVVHLAQTRQTNRVYCEVYFHCTFAEGDECFVCIEVKHKRLEQPFDHLINRFFKNTIENNYLALKNILVQFFPGSSGVRGKIFLIKRALHWKVKCVKGLIRAGQGEIE